MAYAASGLSRMAGDSNGNIWTYNTADAIGTVNTAGYFNSAANMLKIRDIIYVKGSRCMNMEDVIYDGGN